MIVHIFDINFEVNLNLLHFHTVFWIIMFVTCTFLLWYNVYFIICIQIKDYLMQNLYNCIATLCLSRVYHHRVYTWFIYENWKCNTDFIFIDTYKNIRNIQMFLNNIRTDEFLWFWPLDFIPYREMEWNLDFDGIEERQRDCGKDRNRGLPAMALIVNEFTSFLRRFVIRLNCVYGMEFMSCDSSFDLLCLSFFFFFLVLLSFESLFKRVILIDTAF